MAPSSPEMTILEPSTRGNEWLISKKPFNPNSLADLPKQCYIFLDVANYPPADGRRERLLAHFNVPEFVGSRTCFELNGYFGSKASYDDKSDVKRVMSYTTWFRCLVKMIRKVGECHDDGPEYATGKKDYKWFEMSFFTRWDYPNTCQVLCVDTPPDFPTELRNSLQKQTQRLDFRDPFAMHAGLIDQMVVYYDVSVWRIRDPVRLIEKSRMRAGAAFGPMHEISRHAVHTAEILEASADTLTELQQARIAVHQRLPEDLGETYREQAKDYAQFQISLLRNLKLRSDSNQERLVSEVNLAFNNMARQDNSVMKSIALLTMVFLPATFISALFSTTFFNMNDDDGSWMVSDKLWVYWATTVPATIIIVVLWQYWLANQDAIVAALEAPWKMVKAWSAKRKSAKQTRSKSEPA